MPYYCLTLCKKLKHILACSSEAIFSPRPQGVKSFFRKYENVTFLHLYCSNFVQNIKSFWRADPEISALQTNEQTDEAEFIGPFWLKSWVQ